jgi:hypothetical protein
MTRPTGLTREMPAELVREPGEGRFGVDLVEPRSRQGVDGQVVHNGCSFKRAL